MVLIYIYIYTIKYRRLMAISLNMFCKLLRLEACSTTFLRKRLLGQTHGSEVIHVLGTCSILTALDAVCILSKKMWEVFQQSQQVLAKTKARF